MLAQQDISDFKLLRPREAAALIGLSESTLAKKRSAGDGPKFIRISRTRIAYRLSALMEWLDEREYG